MLVHTKQSLHGLFDRPSFLSHELLLASNKKIDVLFLMALMKCGQLMLVSKRYVILNVEKEQYNVHCSLLAARIRHLCSCVEDSQPVQVMYWLESTYFYTYAHPNHN